MLRSTIAVFLEIYFWMSASVDSARILAFLPMAIKSHHHVYQPIVYELARRGHEVLYFSPYNMSRPHPNVTFVQSIDTLGLVLEKFGEGIFGKVSVLESAYTSGEISLFTTETILSSPATRKLIHSSEHFDLILHESFFGQDFSSAFQHKFNAHGVMLVPCADSSWANEISGLTDNPSYMADYRVAGSDKMTFWQRIYSAYVLIVTVGMGYYYQMRTESIVKEHCNYTGWESRPSITSLVFDQALILVNSHNALSYSFPKSPHVKQIGGINVVESQPLPQALENFMNSAKHGVIYFSFGSIVNSNMAGGLRNAFSKAFSRIPQKVLWKWNGSPWEHIPDNVMLSNWFPQLDILAHSNVKLFISHGGLLSLFEAVHHAVPLIVVPFFADQERNSQFVATSGFGLNLDSANISDESISWALNEVLHNDRAFNCSEKVTILFTPLLNYHDYFQAVEQLVCWKSRRSPPLPLQVSFENVGMSRYKKEATRRSTMLKTRQMQPSDEAAFWIEYVLDFGKALQPASVHLPFVQYHLLDIWLFVSAMSGLVVCSIVFLWRRITALIRARVRKIKQT